MSRKEELDLAVKHFEKRIRETRDECTRFDQSLEHHRREFAKLQDRQTQAYRREALGSPSDRAAIEAEINNVDAKIKGLASLSAEKQQETTRLLTEMEPLSHELGEIAHQEELARELAEIEATAEQGKQFIAAYFRAINGLAQVAIKLRSCTSANRSRAFGYAENLLNAKEGVRPERIFTQQELAEFSKVA